MSFKEIYRDKRTIGLFVLLIAAGVFLMLGTDKTEAVQEKYEKTETDDNIEEKMESILSDVKGAGNVKVMITYKAGSEKIVAYNTDKESENKEEGFTSNEKSEPALAKDSPIVLKEMYPEIEGVLIVAEGGGNIQVKNNLISASMALLPVDVNKIEVLVMKKEA